MNIFLSIGLSIFLSVLFFLILSIRFEKFIRSEKTLQRIHDEIETMLMEVNQVSDQNITLLEDRIAVIRSLLEESRKTISLFRSEQEKQKKSVELYSNIQQTIQQKKQIQTDTAGADTAGTAPVTRERKQQILDLYRNGFSISNIAKRFRMPAGEVELLVSLEGYQEQ